MTAPRSHKPVLFGALNAACVALFLAGPLLAQTVDVSFTKNDDSRTVSGRLTGVTAESFVVSTQAGNITLLPDDVTCTSKACPVTGPPPREQVPPQMRRIALSSLDKRIDIEGELQSVSDERWLVAISGLGRVSFERRGLRCSGPGCLVTAAMILPAPPLVEPLQIVGPHDLTEGVLANVLKSYAAMAAPQSEARRVSPNTYVMTLGETAGTFFVGGTGTSSAFTALAAGAADFVIAGRQPNTTETQALVQGDLGDLRASPYETLLAVDGLVVVTHPDLTLPQLTLAQVSRIYSGEITNWSLVGGPDQSITVLAREAGSDENAIFDAAIFEEPQQHFKREAIVLGASQELKATLAVTPFSIGYLWKAHSEGLNTVDLLGSCGLTIRADRFSLKAGDTVMGGRTYIYRAPAVVTEASQMFAAYAAGDVARSGLKNAGLISSEIERLPLSQLYDLPDLATFEDGLQTQVASQLADQITGWDRLTTTLRVEDDGETLGPVAQGDMNRLLAYLATLPAGSEAAVIGFTGGSDDFAASVATANTMAKRIATDLAARAKDQAPNVSIGYAGYGSLLPVFCDDDTGGKDLNRRTEIWVRGPAR